MIAANAADKIKNGLAAQGAGRHEEAVLLLSQALKLDPGSTVAQQGLGASLLALKRNHEALAIFNEVVAAHANDAVAHYNLGIAQRLTGNPAAAVASLTKACDLDPDFLQAHLSLAATLEQMRDVPGALSHCRTAARLSPNAPQLLAKLAELLDSTGETGEARDVLQKAVTLAPGEAGVHGALGRILTKLNDPAAVTHLAAAVRLRPDVRSLASNLFNAFSHNDQNFESVDSNFLEETFRRHNSLPFKQHLSAATVKVSPVAEIEAWAQRAGAPVIEIDRPADLTLVDGDPPQQDRYHADATRVVQLRNAELICGWDQAVAASGEVLAGSGYMAVEKSFGWFPHVFCRRASKILHPWSDGCASIEAPALFMSTPQEYQIGHWIIDFLPRLRAREFITNGAGLKIAVPETLPRRHREMMAHFGVNSDHVLNLSLAQRYRFETLYVLTQSHRNAPHPGKVEYLHRMFSRGGAGDGRIFLQRSQTNRGRGIANQDEFDAVLRDFQFKTVNLADLSVAAQSEVVGSAQLVIGSMGSDLSSIFYLSKGAQLVALIQDDTVETGVDEDVRAFERYGAILDIPVRRFVCKSVGEPQRAGSGKRAGYYRNMLVDCDRLRRLLTQLLAGTT